MREITQVVAVQAVGHERCIELVTAERLKGEIEPAGRQAWEGIDQELALVFEAEKHLTGGPAATNAAAGALDP